MKEYTENTIRLFDSCGLHTSLNLAGGKQSDNNALQNREYYDCRTVLIIIRKVGTLFKKQPSSFDVRKRLAFFK